MNFLKFHYLILLCLQIRPFIANVLQDLKAKEDKQAIVVELIVVIGTINLDGLL